MAVILIGIGSVSIAEKRLDKITTCVRMRGYLPDARVNSPLRFRRFSINE